MIITFIAITLCKGGAQRMLVELANGLSRKGHTISFVLSRNGVIEYPLTVPVLRSENQAISASDIPFSDVIVSNFYTLISPCEAASRMGKGTHVRISLCYEPVFLNDHEASFKSYHVTKNLVVLSEWQKELIQLNHGITGEIVPVGISSQFRNFGQRNINRPLQITGILRITEGGYSWHREQEYLVETFESLQKKYPHVNFNFITPPSEYRSSPSLQKILSNHKFNSLQPTDDEMLNGHYNFTDIFVSSSTYDTASLPGLEAMKCGAALVTVYSGGNMDYCKHEKNCLISYKHENKLFEHISTLIENPDMRHKLSRAGEAEAHKWTWEKSVHLFEQAIDKFKNGR